MFLEATSGSDLTPVKFSILLVLRDHPNLEQVNLAAQVGIDRSNLAEILARMTKDGLVKTAQSANDRRAKLAALTKRGFNTLEQYEKRVLHTHARLLEDLTPNQRRDFMDMLNIIVTAKNDLGRARYSILAPTA
jgi:DNA-binding MarR family transcriptional regulator